MDFPYEQLPVSLQDAVYNLAVPRRSRLWPCFNELKSTFIMMPRGYQKSRNFTERCGRMTFNGLWIDWISYHVLRFPDVYYAYQETIDVFDDSSLTVFEKVRNIERRLPPKLRSHLLAILRTTDAYQEDQAW